MDELGFIPLMALALFVGSQIELKPIDNTPDPVCQRWYDYQGRGEDGRAQFNYEHTCNETKGE